MPTIHLCNPSAPGKPLPFGKRGADCPRCAELAAGAPARQWRETARQRDVRQCADVAAHFASARHRSGGCGPVCTYGEW